MTARGGALSAAHDAGQLAVELHAARAVVIDAATALHDELGEAHCRVEPHGTRRSLEDLEQVLDQVWKHDPTSTDAGRGRLPRRELLAPRTPSTSTRPTAFSQRERSSWLTLDAKRASRSMPVAVHGQCR